MPHDNSSSREAAGALKPPRLLYAAWSSQLPLRLPWGDMFSSHGKYPNWIIVAKNILEHLQCQRVSSVTVRRFRNPYLPWPSKIGGTHMYILHWLVLIQWLTRPINWNKTKRNDKTAWNGTRDIQWGKSKEPSWKYNKSVDCGANQSEACASR